MPGTRAPHLVLKQAGALISTLDLFGTNFVVLTGAEGSAWQAAAAAAAKALGVPIDVWRIGAEQGLEDVEGRFPDAYGVRPDGAVLVRPDSFVAWRASAKADPQKLIRILSSILARAGH